MIYYEEKTDPVRLTIGKDAAYYHPQAAHVFWNSDLQPYGYAALDSLLKEMDQVI